MKRRSNRLNPHACYGGKFQRVCGSIIHDEEEYKTEKLIDLHVKKKILIANYKLLLEKQIIGSRTRYICERCVAIVLKPAEEKESTSKENDDTVSEDQILKFSDAGNELSNIVKKDILKLYLSNGDMKDITTIMNHQSQKWLAERPVELLHILANLCKIDVNTTTDHFR